ncbi:MAG: hypothetical protein V4642_14440 [Bacteroidota bacterium]
MKKLSILFLFALIFSGLTGCSLYTNYYFVGYNEIEIQKPEYKFSLSYLGYYTDLPYDWPTHLDVPLYVCGNPYFPCPSGYLVESVEVFPIMNGKILRRDTVSELAKSEPEDLLFLAPENPPDSMKIFVRVKIDSAGKKIVRDDKYNLFKVSRYDKSF